MTYNIESNNDLHRHILATLISCRRLSVRVVNPRGIIGLHKEKETTFLHVVVARLIGAEHPKVKNVLQCAEQALEALRTRGPNQWETTWSSEIKDYKRYLKPNSKEEDTDKPRLIVQTAIKSKPALVKKSTSKPTPPLTEIMAMQRAITVPDIEDEDQRKLLTNLIQIRSVKKAQKQRLARVLDLTLAEYDDLESGKTKINYSQLRLIAYDLNVKISYFFAGIGYDLMTEMREADIARRAIETETS